MGSDSNVDSVRHIGAKLYFGMFSAIKIDSGALFYGSLNFVLTVGMTPKASTGSSNVTCSVHCSEAVRQTSESTSNV